MSNLFDRISNAPFFLGFSNANTKTGLLLDTAYTYNSAGKAVGFKFVAPTTSTLTTVYFFVSAIAGTPGVQTIELRNWLSGGNQPGATLHASQTVSPGTTANKWIVCTFSTPYTVTQGTVYWIVIGDANTHDGNNAATVLYVGACKQGGIISPNQSYTSTDGFHTAGTFSGFPSSVVIKFGNGILVGMPYTNSVAYTSNTYERGIKIVGLTEQLTISGVSYLTASSNINGLKIYSGTTIPGGTTDLTLAFATGSGGTGTVMFAPFTLKKNTVYRIVLVYGGGAATAPYYFSNEDNSQADCLACGISGGNMYATIDGGLGAWVDDTASFPEMALLIQDQVQIPASFVADAMVGGA